MLKKPLVLFLLSVLSLNFSSAQEIFSTAGLLKRNTENQTIGQLSIYQDAAIDTLIGRYILYNSNVNGIDGFRIQIYSSSNRNAKEEAAKAKAVFMSVFQDTIVAYDFFEKPAYYKIRVGDFRTKTEGIRYLLAVKKVFPNAYFVPDIINFPE